jgi:hypothetical protein
MAYKQGIERAALSIEQDTENVPNDGKFYVLHEGSIKGNYRALKQAQAKYKEILESLNLPPLEGQSAEERAAAVSRMQARIAVDQSAMETFAAAKRRNVRKKTRTFG